ncbi:MAG: 16S rRNA (cytidine(1402)-2'-O)-methyltransferase [Vagococcus sp.]
MKQQKSYKNNTNGTLFLVPTPIGNLEDITFRAIRVLKEATIIASEDTRNTQKLLNHFEIHTKQISLHEHNANERVPELIDRLISGDVIAQVSDAGMPSISDPGHELVKEAINHDIPVISLPGATAGVTALIASGLSPQPFLFHGFLPRKLGEQKDVLTDLKRVKGTIIFYESPHRIVKTLESIGNVLGKSRQVVLCRELTKIHEEYTRGTIEELATFFNEQKIKGECCLMVEGFDGVEPEDAETLDLSVMEHVDMLMKQDNMTSKQAIKQVARLRDLKKQDVYKEYHK